MSTKIQAHAAQSRRDFHKFYFKPASNVFSERRKAAGNLQHGGKSKEAILSLTKEFVTLGKTQHLSSATGLHCDEVSAPEFFVFLQSLLNF